MMHGNMRETELTTLAALVKLDRRLATLEAGQHHILTRVTSMSEKVEALNDWHNVVSGGLVVLGALTSASFAVALVVLSKVLGS